MMAARGIVRLRRTTVAVVCLLSGLLTASAPCSYAAAAPRIVAIEIEGAVHTDRETVLRLARVKEGDRWREGREATVRQLLLNAEIFYDVTVTSEHETDGVRLRIALKEKWTLIPIPVVSFKDGVTTWGGSVVESNLLGTGSSLFALLTVEQSRVGGLLAYLDPHLGGTRVQLFGIFSHTDDRRGMWDAAEEIGSYRRKTTGGFLSIGYRYATVSTIAVGFRLTDYSFDEPREEGQPPADARERAVSLMLRYEGANTDEDRLLGLSATLNLETGVSFLGDEIGRAAASGTMRWAHSIFDRHTLSLTGHALWTDSTAYEDTVPATGFLRGYEMARFRPDRLLGGTLEYQLPVARFRMATVSFVPFADAALLRDRYRSFSLPDAQADAGLALAVYLRRVALPVLQIYGAYGFVNDKVLFGFSLGFRF